MSKKTGRRIIDISGEDQRDAKMLSTLFDEDSHSSSGLKILLLAVVTLIFVFLIWSFVTKVEELAKARGELKPVMQTQKIQSEEGGRLSEILVRRDDIVKKGQVLARFSSTNINKDLSQIQVQLASMEINLERLGAILDGSKPDFSAYDSYPGLVTEARALYKNQLELNKDRIASKQQQLAQRQSELRGLQSELPSVQAELASLKSILERKKEGVARQVIAAVEVAEAERSVASGEVSLKEIESNINETKQAIASARSDLESIEGEIRQDILTERNQALEKVNELKAEIEALETRGGLREILSPVDGFVQTVPETSAGTVIQPGGLVVEIVPSKGGVYMEAKIQPRDVGFIKAGQKALVKIDSYDFSRFGAIEGSVSKLSPSSFTNERDGSVYYIVEIKLDTQYVGERHQIIPGMTGEVDIVTGEKTVFQYIAKPVFTGLDTAFSER